MIVICHLIHFASRGTEIFLDFNVKIWREKSMFLFHLKYSLLFFRWHFSDLYILNTCWPQMVTCWLLHFFLYHRCLVGIHCSGFPQINYVQFLVRDSLNPLNWNSWIGSYKSRLSILVSWFVLHSIKLKTIFEKVTMPN